MKTKQSRQNRNDIFTLQKTARVTLPIYKKIAIDDRFAQRWCQAVRKAEIDSLDRMIKQTIPAIYEHQYALSVNGIGYFIDVIVPRPLGVFTNSTAIPPGRAQFHFQSRAQQTIAQHILPFYQAIISSASFSNAIVKAVKRKENQHLEQIVRSKVSTPHLFVTRTFRYGFALRFSFPFDSYPYDHQLFHEVP